MVELARAEFRSIAVDQLQETFKDQADAIKVVDFLWDLKIKARK
jgi:hypothetical protein